MPFDLSGNFTRLYNFAQDRDNGVKILASHVDGEFDNLATGMNAVFFRDGRVPMQSDLRMNINGISALKDGALGSPAIQFNTDGTTGPYLDGAARYAIQVSSVQRGVFSATGLNVVGAITQNGVALAPLVSPAFTGVPSGPTATPGTNTSQLATTAYVTSSYATLGGPTTFTGTVTLPNVYLNGASGVSHGLFYLTGGSYSADISLQTDNVTLRHNVNTAHQFSLAGVQKLIINASGATFAGAGTFGGAVSAPSLAISGASGGVQISPRDLGANVTSLYSPTGYDYRISQGTDIVQVTPSVVVANTPVRSNTGSLTGRFGFGDGTKYLNYDGTNFSFVGGAVLATTPTAGDSSTKVATTAFTDPLRGLPPSSGGGKTLTLADRGNMYIATGDCTVPASVFSAGDVTVVYNNSAASIALAQGSGLTLRWSGTATTGSRSILQRGFATITFITATEAVVSGDVS